MKQFEQKIELIMKKPFRKGNIVFIHGFNSNWFKYHVMLEHLYSENYNVYAFDLPNNGMNTNFPKQFLFKEYCQYATEWINKNVICKNVILIGHSMGGGIVAAINKSIKNVIKIILIDPLQQTVTNNVPTLGLKSLLNSTTASSLISTLFKIKKDKAADPNMLLFDLASSKTYDIIEKGLNTITVPTMVIFGKNDDVIPPNASIIYLVSQLKLAPTINVALIDEAGHSPLLTHFPESYKKLLYFLLNT